MWDGSNPIGISEFADKTTVNPVGLTILVLAAIALLCVSRRMTMLVLIACMSFLASGQRVVIFGLDFSFLRILVLVGWTRILARGEQRQLRWNRMDTYIIAWNFASFVLYIASHGVHTTVFKLGMTFDSLAAYFLFRCLIRDLDDVKSLINVTAIIAVVVAFFFIYEFQTRQNVFSIFGGVPAITDIREGKLRCQGAYAHPILAGCFWAAIVQLLIARALKGKSGRILSIIGLVAALVIVALSNSSTPIVGAATGMLGFMLYPLRQSMRLVRWAISLFLITLQAVMLKPIYTLIQRVTLSQGNTGDHRVAIIEASLKYLHEWIFIGSGNINHWGIYRNDITNKYIAEGLGGGFIVLGLFMMLIVTGFSNVGKLWRRQTHSAEDMLLAWAIGVSLCVHTVNFIGVFYYGQIEMLWNISLALTAISPVAISQRRLSTTASPQLLRQNGAISAEKRRNAFK